MFAFGSRDADLGGLKEATLSHDATNPLDTRRASCRNRQKNDCFKKFEELQLPGGFCIDRRVASVGVAYA